MHFSAYLLGSMYSPVIAYWRISPLKLKQLTIILTFKTSKMDHIVAMIVASIIALITLWGELEKPIECPWLSTFDRGIYILAVWIFTASFLLFIFGHMFYLLTLFLSAIILALTYGIQKNYKKFYK